MNEPDDQSAAVVAFGADHSRGSASASSVDPSGGRLPAHDVRYADSRYSDEGTSVSSATFMNGGSISGQDSDLDTAAANAADDDSDPDPAPPAAAVAAAAFRDTKPEVMIARSALTATQLQQLDAHNDREDSGNIVIYFTNHGEQPHERLHRCAMNEQFKKQPCAIIALNECNAATQGMLESEDPAVVGREIDGPAGTPLGKFANRHPSSYITVRPSEKSSCLLGVRPEVAESIEVLYWERRFHCLCKVRAKGKVKKQSKKSLAPTHAY